MHIVITIRGNNYPNTPIGPFATEDEASKWLTGMNWKEKRHRREYLATPYQCPKYFENEWGKAYIRSIDPPSLYE